MASVEPKAAHDAVRNMGAMTKRLGLPTAPAAWPAGVSLLAQAIDACQRCDAGTVCDDWLARAPKAIEVAPPFCPNAPRFARARQVKRK